MVVQEIEWGAGGENVGIKIENLRDGSAFEEQRRREWGGGGGCTVAFFGARGRIFFLAAGAAACASFPATTTTVSDAADQKCAENFRIVVHIKSTSEFARAIRALLLTCAVFLREVFLHGAHCCGRRRQRAGTKIKAYAFKFNPTTTPPPACCKH